MSVRELFLGRFKLDEYPLKGNGLGTLYSAKDKENEWSRVRVWFIDPNELGDEATRAHQRIEFIVHRPAELTAFPRVLIYELFEDDPLFEDGQWLIVTDQVSNVHAGHLLKERGLSRLSPEEAVRLLGNVASALDYCDQMGVNVPPLTVKRLLIAMPDGEKSEHDILKQPVSQWPSDSVKLDLLSKDFVLLPPEAAPQNPGMSIASLLVGLLGGEVVNGYPKPIKALGERGNKVLHRALQNEYRSAIEVINEMQPYIGTELSAPLEPETNPAPPSIPPTLFGVPLSRLAAVCGVIFVLWLLYYFAFERPYERDRADRSERARMEWGSPNDFGSQIRR